MYNVANRAARLGVSLGLMLSLTTVGLTNPPSEGANASEPYHHPVIPAPLCSTSPVIDGVLDDAVWQEAYHSDEFWNTDYDCPPAERTEIWVCFDAQALYVAIYAHDSQPGEIRCQETNRGGNLSNDDYCTVTVDPDYTGNRMYSFRVTANGTQSENIPGGSDAKIQWRGDWNAAGRLVADGWVAEARIPFAILRYPAGQSVWGISIARRCPRLAEQWNWPPQRQRWDSRQIAEIVNLSLPGSRPRPLLMVTTQAEASHEYARINVGLDSRYTHPSGLTGVFSWQPDFRDVEEEVESIDFSYTERAYGDRRPFFVEGGGYMPPRTVFYTHRIPEFDLGLKVFGSQRDTSLGMLAAWDFGERQDLALNLSQQLGYDASVAVGYVRTDQPALEADSFYVRGNYSHPIGSGDFSARARFYGSHDSEGSEGKSWSVRVSRDQGYGRPKIALDYRYTDADFFPRLGFAPEVDLQGWSGSVSVPRRFQTGRTLSSNTWVGFDLIDRTDGSRYHHDLGVGHGVSYRDGWNWSISWSHSDRPPYLDQVWRGSVGWNTDELNRGGGLSVRRGRLADANYLSASIWQGFRLNSSWTWSAGYEMRRSDYPSPQADEWLQRATLSFNYDISSEHTLGGRLLAGTPGTNFFLTYRQAVRQGTDLFVILGDPNAQNTEVRLALKAKSTY